MNEWDYLSLQREIPRRAVPAYTVLIAATSHLGHFFFLLSTVKIFYIITFPLAHIKMHSLRAGLMREPEQSEHRVLASPSRQGVGLEVHEKTRHQQLACSRAAGRKHSSAGTGSPRPGLRRPCG